MDDQKLIEAARKARDMAYAPYSKFHVGAALLTADGDMITGCNVENASLGLSICAERNAVFAAVASGRRDLVAVAIVAGETEPAAPCGACRQVLAEFGIDMRVILATPEGDTKEFTLRELLPEPFLAFRPDR